MNNKDTIKWVVSSSDDGETLLEFISKKNQREISKKKIKRIIDLGLCRVNGSAECFSSRRLKINEKIELYKSWKNHLEKTGVISSPKILYEDEYFLGIDKPPGLVCEPASIASFFPKSYQLIHRLDKGTSGVLLLSKTKEMKKAMIKLFSEKKVEKVYVAIVDKPIKKKKGKIETYLVRRKNIDGQTLWGSSGNNKGLYALTLWECLRSNELCSYLHCRLITGRTHQLRVHLSEINHAVLGDYFYEKNFSYPKYVPRLLLHSWNTSFIHPFLNKKIEIFSEIPSIFNKICKI
jgi:RluA family pseudouridine synthase